MSAGHIPAEPAGLSGRLRLSVSVLYREIAKFGVVGAVAFVVDAGIFNLLRSGIIGGEAGLAGKPLTAKTISVFVATIVAWAGNRWWTFRHRRSASRQREFLLFLVMNVGGLGISLACLGFSHYVLGLTSALSDNIAGNGVGLILGTLFRFWAYKAFVFTSPEEVAYLEASPESDDGPQADILDLRPRGTQPIPADPLTQAEPQRREA